MHKFLDYLFQAVSLASGALPLLEQRLNLLSFINPTINRNLLLPTLLVSAVTGFFVNRHLTVKIRRGETAVATKPSAFALLMTTMCLFTMVVLVRGVVSTIPLLESLLMHLAYFLFFASLSAAIGGACAFPRS